MRNCFRTASQIVDPVETVQIPVDVQGCSTFQSPAIVTGKQGRAPGELNSPRGVAIDGVTNQIFVASYLNHRVEVFSETGEYLYQLGVGQLYIPYGIAIHGDSVYVSCGDDTVSKFSLTVMSLVRKIGGMGTDNGQFKSPRQLTTDPIGRVFIPDAYNHRICVHDPNLNHLYNITLQSMTYPLDVKIPDDRLYVLCSNAYVTVLTLEGDKLYTLINHKQGMDTYNPSTSVLNQQIISDYVCHLVRVFSTGNPLHTIQECSTASGVSDPSE